MEFIPWFGRFILLAVLYLFLLEALRMIAADIRTGEVPAADRVREAALEVVASRGEPQPGVSFPLDGEVRIGRAPDCQVTIPDVYVSNYHARLYLLDGRHWIEDLDSTNGTLLNGRRVTVPAQVGNGDSITVGPVTLQVRLSGR